MPTLSAHRNALQMPSGVPIVPLLTTFPSSVVFFSSFRHHIDAGVKSLASRYSPQHCSPGNTRCDDHVAQPASFWRFIGIGNNVQSQSDPLSTSYTRRNIQGWQFPGQSFHHLDSDFHKRTRSLRKLTSGKQASSCMHLW